MFCQQQVQKRKGRQRNNGVRKAGSGADENDIDPGKDEEATRGTYVGTHFVVLQHFRDGGFAGRERVVEALQSPALVQAQAETVSVHVRVASPPIEAAQREIERRRVGAVHTQYLTHIYYCWQ